MSGFPLYGADTGGYRRGRPTKESLLRWAEHTALSMVMQLGPGEEKYPWSYDAETTSVYKDLASLHQRLFPYLASLLAAAIADGTPTIRPLPLAFPDDTAGRAFADDEYLLGPGLLVAPVVTPGAKSRSVHVPPGAWFSWWDGARVDGPKTLDVAAPFGKVPLFARAGTILPMLPSGVDTVLPSTDAATVSLTTKSGVAEALAWVSGPATASFLDGSTVTIDDTASGVNVKWTPLGTGSVLTIAIDLSARTGKTLPLSTVTMAGQALTSEAAVRNAPGAAYFLSGNQLVMRMVGATEVHAQ